MSIVLFASNGTRAQVVDEVAGEEASLDGSEEEVADEAREPFPIALGAYAEAYYQWNFGRPSNRITNLRGFDNRHNSFTIANAAVDASWDVRGAVGRVTLQVGHTPSTYYMAEPGFGGASGANATSAELWKFLQQAYAGYRFDVGNGLLVTAGIFLSPIGIESMAIHEGDHWSRSNLFFGLPFYHTGVRLSYPVSDSLVATFAVFNGWNSVVDNNDAKSLVGQLTYAPLDRLSLSFLYFTGVERDTGAPEGSPWRHLFDVHGTFEANGWLTLRAHANGGFEPNVFGTSGWIAGALYARARFIEELRFAVRGDVFREYVASGPLGTAEAIFWPSSWVASLTGTLDYRPHPNVSFRVEYRYDRASGEVYFAGAVTGDGDAIAYVPNAGAQHTATIGATTWY